MKVGIVKKAKKISGVAARIACHIAMVCTVFVGMDASSLEAKKSSLATRRLPRIGWVLYEGGYDFLEDATTGKKAAKRSTFLQREVERMKAKASQCLEDGKLNGLVINAIHQETSSDEEAFWSSMAARSKLDLIVRVYSIPVLRTVQRKIVPVQFRDKNGRLVVDPVDKTGWVGYYVWNAQPSDETNADFCSSLQEALAANQSSLNSTP